MNNNIFFSQNQVEIFTFNSREWKILPKIILTFKFFGLN